MPGESDKPSSAAHPAGLPPPSTAPAASRFSQRRARFLRVTGIFASVAFLTFSALTSPLDAPSFSAPDETRPYDALDAYWDAASARGAALIDPACRPNHPPHRKRPGWISPKDAEKLFLAVPNNDSVAAASRRYTEHAHPAGSGWDYVTALQVKADWEEALGFPVSPAEAHIYDAGSHESQSRIRRAGMGKAGVWIDTYYPVLNTPVSSSLTLLTDPPVHAKLREAVLPGDPGTVLTDEVRVFHGLSVSGDVTGKYVYAGYGRKQDFDLLQARGIDLTGKIVLVKYGGVFRGLKVKAAQEAGAIGVAIFTDPGDDGEITEANGYKTYPDGPARVPSSVQRGSVQFLSMYPGDPTTPGYPAYKDAKRTEGANFPKIPSLPLSYEDAIPLLNALKGKGIASGDLDESFGGGLGYKGVEYWTGPSEDDLHLVNEVNTRVMPVWNTMAVIPGHIQDEVVVMGNHRDAWVLGGSDPNAGTASQYEFVRGLGHLLKKGWKPLRTIVLASWDAEEYGLVGSTEWCEDFGDWLPGHVAAYLNLDSSSSGQNFRGRASPSLAQLLRGAAQEVERAAGRSVWAARTDGGVWADEAADLVADGDAAEAAGGRGSGIAPLGSGSDYTAFLQRYGIASTDFTFSNGPKDPVYHYHSIYDSHTWVRTYGDPGFRRHTEAAQITGLVALRLANSAILPLNTTQYVRDLGYYLDKIEVLKADAPDGTFDDLELGALGDAIGMLAGASAELDAERAHLLAELEKLLPGHHHLCSGAAWLPWNWAGWVRPACLPRRPPRHKLRALLRRIRAVNVKLRDFEAGFISADGIKEREWYKHKGTAPGKWLGYGATTFPALTEAITIEHSPTLAQKEADELAAMIRAMGKRLQA